MSTHERRRGSFGAEVDADAYHRARPRYPQDAVTWALGSRAGVGRVLDLGCGTGILTDGLVAAGHDVVAVDPSPAMLRRLAERHPQVETRTGGAELLPLADGSVDAVVVGQAWHWVDVARASAEVARVLRPGGTLGLLWNLLDHADPWAHELDALCSPPAGLAVAPLVADDVVGAPLRVTHRWSSRWVLLLPDAAGVVALASTLSSVATRPDRDRVAERVRTSAGIRARPDGQVPLAHLTVGVLARRDPDGGTAPGHALDDAPAGGQTGRHG